MTALTLVQRGESHRLELQLLAALAEAFKQPRRFW